MKLRGEVSTGVRYYLLPPGTVIVCPKCNVENARTDNECWNCGENLDGAKREVVKRLGLQPKYKKIEARVGTANMDSHERSSMECGYVYPSEPENEQGCPYPSEPINEQSLDPFFSSHVERVSAYGGVTLLIALVLLIVAWAWQENVESQIKNLDVPHDYDLQQLSDYFSQLKDLTDSARAAHSFWNLGVLIAVIGAAMVAFTKLRK